MRRTARAAGWWRFSINTEKLEKKSNDHQGKKNR